MRNVAAVLKAVQLRRRAYAAANALLMAGFGRMLGIVHLLEYPKCGGSWVRNMLQHYLGGEPHLADRLVGRRSVVQSHELRSWGSCQLVVVVRDPRDLYVSFYYHETFYEQRQERLAVHQYFAHDPQRDLRDDFAAYLEAKLTHRTFPPFQYREFADRWLGRPDICLVRYEDFLTDPVAQLRRIVEYLGAPVDDGRLRATVDFTSFRNETGRIYGVARRPGEADAGKFLRKGVAGDWRNHFNACSCALIWEHESDSLRRLGYEADDGWIEAFLNPPPMASRRARSAP